MTIKLTTKLPKKDERNGLGAIHRQLLADPYRTHLALVVLDTSKITRDLENEDYFPTVRIVAIEPITEGADVARLRTMLQRAYEERTGNVELPADWEAVLTDLAAAPTLPGTGPRR